MSKIIVDMKNIKNTTPFKVKIDGEIVESIIKNSRIESEIGYGEHEIQLYANFIGKTVKRKVDISEKEEEFKITLNYKLWSFIFVIQIIMVLLIMKFTEYAVFIVFPVVIMEFLSIVIFGMFDLKKIEEKEEF